MPLTSNRVLRTFRYAMYFDGIDDYVDCGNNPSLNTTTEATVEAIFFSMNEPWLRKGGRVFAKGNYRLTAIICLSCWPDPKIYIVVNMSPINLRCPADYFVNHYGKWWFITGTLKAGDSIKLYDSGVLKVTAKCLTSPWDISNTNLLIGMCTTDMIHYYKGYIHTVRYYNRVLSDIEIRYNLYNPDDPIRDGLVLWLKSDPNYVKDIDNDGILEWIDLSGYNNHGKIYGATLTKIVKDPISVSQPRRILSVVR